MLKLASINFLEAPRMPGVRASAVSSIDCDNPHDALKHWRVSFRGPMVFFISPPGWNQGKQWHEWDPQGPTTMFEVARVSCCLQWVSMPTKDEKSGALLDSTMVDMDAIAKGKFDVGPFKGPVPPRPEPKGAVPEPIDPKDIGDE